MDEKRGGFCGDVIIHLVSLKEGENAFKAIKPSKMTIVFAMSRNMYQTGIPISHVMAGRKFRGASTMFQDFPSCLRIIRLDLERCM